MCKLKLPLNHIDNNRTYNLLNIECKFDNYVILESLSKDNIVDGLYIIDFTHRNTVTIVILYNIYL